MNRMMIWGTDGLSLKSQASVHLREATIDNRLDSLKEIALALLSEVENLRGSQRSGADRRLKLQEVVRRFESELIRTALERTGGNQSSAAKVLGVRHTTLNAKIKRYKISCVSPVVGSNEVGNEIAA